MPPKEEQAIQVVEVAKDVTGITAVASADVIIVNNRADIAEAIGVTMAEEVVTAAVMVIVEEVC